MPTTDKRILKVERKRVRGAIDQLIKLRAYLLKTCPVCKQVHKIHEIDCTHPLMGPEAKDCPAVVRCTEYLDVANTLLNDLEIAWAELNRLQCVLILKMRPCEHDWHGDQDNHCNVCIKCGLTADHF